MESQKFEYKQNWGNDCLKTVSAMANGTGGVLFIGMDDRGNPVNLKNTKKLLEDIPNTVRNKLRILPAVELSREKGYEVIIVIVQPSSIPISYNGKYYMRSGSTVQELNGKELADFLLKKSGISWDNCVEEQCTLNELDQTTLREFKHLAADRIPGITKETNVSMLLDKLSLIENKKLKRIAVLLFGSNPQKFYSHASVKIGKFLSDTDIQTTDIVKGNLFRQVEDSLEILRLKYLQSNISFEGIHRRDILEYPYEALREAVINALIHREYRGFSQIQIRVYPDKMIIMNEGSLPPEVTVEDLKRNHLSKPRNKLLAEVFYFSGYIEAWGRGTIKILEKCFEQGLPEPDFIDEHGVMSVVFYKDKWNEENLKKLGLNERQIKAVMYVKENGKITNNEYQSFGLKKRQTTDDLKELEKKGILEKVGTTGRGTYYILRGIKRAMNGRLSDIKDLYRT